MTNIIRDRIRAQIGVVGKTPHKVALQAGLEKSFISDFLDEKKKSFSAAHLPGIARALNCDVGYIVGEQDEPGSFQADLPIVGIAEPGTFRSVGGSPDEREPVTPDSRYPAADQVVYRVADNHAIPVGITADSYVTVLISGNGDNALNVRQGDVVIVEKRKGDAVETSIMEVVTIDRRAVLVLPGRVNDKTSQDGLKVIGRVIRSTTNF